MADQRKITRSQAKLRVASAKRTADEKALVKRTRVAAALGLARTILADGAFTSLVRAHGVETLPQPLMTQDPPDGKTGNAPKSSERYAGDCALDFAVAWRFFAPLLNNQAVVILLDTRWPGFTLELRDVFISLVADGPFPYQPIGRERRTI
jgi:hypothetical protein